MHRSCQVLRNFVFKFVFFTGLYFFNLLCICKCDDTFGCKMSFSWLGQKVNKTIDAFGDDADDSSTDSSTG